ncbi:hypothetical protein [Jannaschia rubra]|uniref:hypothetical protein n=1 Tax=Jannaschia rubra TaxID=282197 RepID=UPI00249017E6|nr:hypothetical protein [Jannaschia rubra]
MINRRLLCSTALTTLSMLIALSGPARAQVLNWDGPDAGTVGGDGVWNRTDENFTDGGGPVAFSDGRVVVFDGTPGTVTVEDGTAPAVGGLRFTVGGYIITGDTIAQAAASAATIDLQDAGTTTIGSDLSGEWSAEGTRPNNGTVSNLELTGANGSLTRLTVGRDIAVSGAALDTAAAVVVSAGGSFALGGRIGSLATSGDTDMDGADIAGDVDNRATGTLDVAGDTTVGGRFDNAGAATVQSGTLTVAEVQNAGSLSVDDGARIAGNIVSNGTTADRAAVTIAGTVTGAVTNGPQSDLTVRSPGGVIAGDVVNAGDADLDGTLTGALTNAGANAEALVGGDVQGQVTNENGASLTFDGESTVGGAAIDNRADMDVTGTVTTAGIANTGNGDLTVAASGRVNGDIDSSATLTLAGRVKGDVDVTAGTASVGGRITGDLNLTGGTITQGAALDVDGTLDNGVTLVTTANVDAGRVDTSGNLTVAAGDRLRITRSNGRVTNTGVLTVAGSVRGDIDSSSDLRLTGASGGTVEVTGDVDVTAGSVTLSGDVDGDLRLAAGTTATQTGGLAVSGTLDNAITLTTTADLAAGAVTNAGTLTVATDDRLTVDGGSGAVANTGALTVAGTVAGAIDSSGTLDLNGLRDGVAEVTGDVDVTGGSATVQGDLGGDLTLRAGADVDQTGALSVAGQFLSDTAAGDSRTVDFDLAAGSIVNDGGLSVTGARVSASGAAPLVLRNRGRGDLSMDAASVIDGTVRNGGGAVTLAGGRVTGDLITAGVARLAGSIGGDLSIGASGERTTITGALNVGGGIENDGNLTVGDAVTANGLRNRGDLVVEDAGGLILGGNLVNAGTARIDGDVTAVVLSNTGAGQVTLGGALTGALSNVGGLATLAEGASVSGDVANTAELDVTGAARVGGAFRNGGAMTIDDAGNLTAARLANSGTLDIDGTLTGDLANAARTSLAGTVTGAIINGGELIVDGAARAGSVSSDATLRIEAGGSLASGVEVTGGTIVVDGTLDGSLTNVATGRIAGTVTGPVTNRAAGTLVTVSGTRLGSLDNAGTVRVEDGGVRVSAARNAGTVAVTETAALSGGKITNTGTLTNRGTVDNALVNANGATILSFGGARFDGPVTQAGMLRSDAGLVLAGGGRLQGTSVTDLSQGSGGASVRYDAMDVTGPLVSNGGTLRFDINLNTGAGGGGPGAFADYLRVRDGALTGSLNLAFEGQGTPGALDPGGILVVDVDDTQANAYSVGTVSGLASVGALVYQLEERNGDQFVTTAVNPAVGGLSGTVSLTQALIGQVVNRPSSPFVSALVSPGGDTCGPGVWSRAIGGTASAEGDVTSSTGTFENDLDANYGGVQFGADYGCVDGGIAGYDVTVGGTAGYTFGTVKQDIFDFDPRTGEVITDRITARSENDFDLSYGGVYVAIARGPFVADLQYRYEETEFDLSTRSFVAGGGIGVLDQTFDSTGHTLSGSVSYAMPFGPEDGGWVFVPTAGFALSRQETDPVRFAGGARLELDDTKTKIGFVGGTIARTRVAPDERSALSTFGTATYYADFSDDLKSTFFDSSGGSDRISVENLGSYGEVSVGLNYVRILDKGQVGPARQVTGSVRLDGRLSGRLDSVGVTAQVRLQF